MRSVVEAGNPVDAIQAGDVITRKAGMRDIHPLLVLINSYAAKGIMLPRTEFEMSENIRDFTVIYQESRLIGCGALHFYTPTTAEVRSLAVDPSLKSRGIGRIVVNSLEEEATENELHAIFAFTYAPEFFKKIGFAQVERGELPLKAWRDCLRCPKFQCCDEIAMLKALVPDPVLSPVPDSANFLIQLPQMAPPGDRA
jgi:amino-acid N-acetyltransferase